ncbi:MAG: glycosyltransferase [Planctomycetia bacterium]|nr:glycosyltransferase [Planctomycetia bacterium]
MKKSLSVIIPTYNEQDSLAELVITLKETLKSYSNWVVLFIDDGSTDNSIEILTKIVTNESNFKLIQLHRNYGKSAALAEGFKLAEGDYVITMDADLQDDPQEIPNLISKLEEGYDLVTGWKKDRKDPWTKRFPSKIANAVTGLITGVKVHDMNCGLKIYRRAVVKSLDIYGGRHRYIPALAGQKRFRIAEIPVKHHKRQYGVTKYGGSRLFHGFFDLVTILFLNRYTEKPLHLFGIFGLSCLMLSFFSELYVVFLKIFLNHPFQKHFAMMLFGVMLFVLGLWFFSIGLIGEMVAQTTQDREDRVKNILGS